MHTEISSFPVYGDVVKCGIIIVSGLNRLSTPHGTGSENLSRSKLSVWQASVQKDTKQYRLFNIKEQYVYYVICFPYGTFVDVVKVCRMILKFSK